MIKEAMSFASGVGASLGFGRAPMAEIERRQQICESCPHIKESAGFKKCGKCGCFVHLKIRVAKQRCPIDSWGPVESHVDRVVFLHVVTPWGEGVLTPMNGTQFQGVIGGRMLSVRPVSHDLFFIHDGHTQRDTRLWGGSGYVKIDGGESLSVHAQAGDFVLKLIDPDEAQPWLTPPQSIQPTP